MGKHLQMMIIHGNFLSKIIIFQYPNTLMASGKQIIETASLMCWYLSGFLTLERS